MGKKLPLYGYNILHQKNLLPLGYSSQFLFVFIGHQALKMSAKWQPFAMAIIPWQSPQEFFWPVKGRKVAIFDTGYADDDYLKELVIELYKAQALEVIALSPDYFTTIFKKG